MPADDRWRTTDLTTAAYLRSIGFRYEIIVEGTTALFTFSDGPSLRRSHAEYVAGDATVEPEEFSKWLLRLRTEMFSKIDGCEGGAA